MKKKTGRLLDILITSRMRDELDSTLHNYEDFQDALKKQDIAFKQLDKLKLSRKQSLIIDKAISANNHYTCCS